MRRAWKPPEIRNLIDDQVFTRHRRGQSGEVEFPIPVEQMIREAGLRLLVLPDIIPDGGSAPNAGQQIAGLIDRELRRIEISEKFGMACRRYTAGHELGHWYLHQDEVIYHRDEPLVGSERTEVAGRVPVELEADIFSAELLMPATTVRAFIEARFRLGVIRPEDIDETLAYRLSRGVRKGKPILSAAQHRTGSRRVRSKLIATDSVAWMPLVDVFGVSETAMAIRLEELDLVR